MKKIPARYDLLLSPAGFSLIELAMGMALVGIILGGALLIGGRFYELDRREETRQYLRETKSALLIFAKKNGRLPMMDTSTNETIYGNGSEDKIPGEDDYPSSSVFGWVPFTNIGIRSEDPYRKRVQYFVNWQLAKEGDKPCQALKNLLGGNLRSTEPFPAANNPSFYSYDKQAFWTPPQPTTTWYPRVIMRSTYRFPVAAVLVSAAQNNTFDSANLTAYRGSKYFDMQPSDSDDIAEYISLAEAYEALNCQ